MAIDLVVVWVAGRIMIHAPATLVDSSHWPHHNNLVVFVKAALLCDATVSHNTLDIDATLALCSARNLC